MTRMGERSSPPMGGISLRFWMQWVRADFSNPLGYFVITVTNPLVVPMRRAFPSMGTLDTATLLLAYVVALFKIWLLTQFFTGSPSFANMLVFSLGELIRFSIHIFFAAIFIQIIVSWLSPGTYHPILNVARDIAEPLMAPLAD